MSNSTFTYKNATPEQQDRISCLEDSFNTFCTSLKQYVTPDNRYYSLLWTALETAFTWAVKSVTHVECCDTTKTSNGPCCNDSNRSL